MNIINKYVVYFHVNPIKQEIFYIGIGDRRRPYQTKNKRSIYWERYIKKYPYQIIIIHKDLSWKQACELEIKYINQIGRRDKGLGTLINLTNGGDGIYGYTHNKKVKKFLSENNRDKIIVKDKYGNIFKVLKNDPKYVSGELVHHSKDILKIKDEFGNILRVERNNPENIKIIEELKKKRRFNRAKRVRFNRNNIRVKNKFNRRPFTEDDKIKLRKPIGPRSLMTPEKLKRTIRRHRKRYGLYPR